MRAPGATQKENQGRNLTFTKIKSSVHPGSQLLVLVTQHRTLRIQNEKTETKLDKRENRATRDIHYKLETN